MAAKKTIRRGDPRAAPKPAQDIPPEFKAIIEEEVGRIPAQDVVPYEPDMDGPQRFDFEVGRMSRREVLGELQEVIDNLGRFPVPFTSPLNDENGKRTGFVSLGERRGERTPAPDTSTARLVIEFQPIDRADLDGYLRDVYAQVAQASWRGHGGEVSAAKVYRVGKRALGSFWYVESM